MIDTDIQRTTPQNNSAHLWMQEIAEALNASGHTVNSKAILRLDVPWTKSSVKEFLFRSIMQAMYPEKTSTTQLTKEEWSNVVEALNLAIGERAGVYVEYPSRGNDEF